MPGIPNLLPLLPYSFLLGLQVTHFLCTLLFPFQDLTNIVADAAGQVHADELEDSALEVALPDTEDGPEVDWGHLGGGGGDGGGIGGGGDGGADVFSTSPPFFNRNIYKIDL